jgi:hypothetical protein
MLVKPVTLPIPLSSDKVVAPLTDQLSVLLAPTPMMLGPAMKPAMVGFCTVTVSEAVAVPAELVAVSV